MEMMDRIMGKDRTRVKRKRVTKNDILGNIRRITDAMDKMKEGTDEYERLAKEREHEYVVLRKYMDARYYIEPKDWLKIAGATAMIVFFVCLEREVPAATKFCGLVMKAIPYRG